MIVRTLISLQFRHSRFGARTTVWKTKELVRFRKKIIKLNFIAIFIDKMQSPVKTEIILVKS